MNCCGRESALDTKQTREAIAILLRKWRCEIVCKLIKEIRDRLFLEEAYEREPVKDAKGEIEKDANGQPKEQDKYSIVRDCLEEAKNLRNPGRRDLSKEHKKAADKSVAERDRCETVLRMLCCLLEKVHPDICKPEHKPDETQGCCQNGRIEPHKKSAEEELANLKIAVLKIQARYAALFRIKAWELRCELPAGLRYWFDLHWDGWLQPLCCHCSKGCCGDGKGCCGAKHERGVAATHDCNRSKHFNPHDCQDSCGCAGHPCCAFREKPEAAADCWDKDCLLIYELLIGEPVGLGEPSKKATSRLSYLSAAQKRCWEQAVHRAGDAMRRASCEELAERQKRKDVIHWLLGKYGALAIRYAANQLGYSLYEINQFDLIDDDCAKTSSTWTEWCEWQAADRLSMSELEYFAKILKKREDGV